ncbi:MAG TPA: PH domain-containing protein [Iamia sp.]
MGEPRVVLERPWWARVLGPNPITAILIGAVGWTVPVVPLRVLAGDLVGAGVTLALGGTAWALCALGWRIGVTVDDDGITVQNLIFRHRIPWTGIVRLDLYGGGRYAGPSADVIRRPGRFGRPVEITALGLLGRPRRVAWLDAVAPILARHGVPIAVKGTGPTDWHGIQAPYEGYHGPLRAPGPWWRQTWDRPVTRQDRVFVGILGGIAAVGVAAAVLALWWDGEWQSPLALSGIAIGLAALHIVPLLLVGGRRSRSESRPSS